MADTAVAIPDGWEVVPQPKQASIPDGWEVHPNADLILQAQAAPPLATEQSNALRGAIAQANVPQSPDWWAQRREDSAKASASGTPAIIREPAYALAGLGGSLAGTLSRPFSKDVADYHTRNSLDIAEEADIARQKDWSPWLSSMYGGIVQSAAQAAGTAPLGQGGMIAGFALTEGNQALYEAEQAGLKGADRIKYAVLQGGIEGSIAGALSLAGLGGTEKFISDMAKGVMKTSWKQAGKLIGPELFEELLTELHHAGVEAAYGVSPEAMKSENFWPRMRDTVVQTIGQFGLAQGVAKVAQLRQKANDIDVMTGKGFVTQQEAEKRGYPPGSRKDRMKAAKEEQRQTEKQAEELEKRTRELEEFIKSAPPRTGDDQLREFINSAPPRTGDDQLREFINGAPQRTGDDQVTQQEPSNEVQKNVQTGEQGQGEVQPGSEAQPANPEVQPPVAEAAPEPRPLIGGAPQAPPETDPQIPQGMTRLYHGSGEHGRYTGAAWYSTNREYAANYRGVEELQYVDVPTKWAMEQLDPDGYGTPASTLELKNDEFGPRKPIPPDFPASPQATTQPQVAPEAVPGETGGTEIDRHAKAIADRTVPLTSKQIKQYAQRNGIDPASLLTTVRKLRSQPLTGEALEEQRRRSAEGVRQSELQQRREQKSQERFADEVDSIHDAMFASGWTLDKTSESGSRYYSRGTELARVSDHAANEATQAWIDKNGVHEISRLEDVPKPPKSDGLRPASSEQPPAEQLPEVPLVLKDLGREFPIYIGNSASETASGEEAPEVTAKPKTKVRKQKKSKDPQTLAQAIQELGGLSPKRLKAGGIDIHQDLKQAGVPLNVFKNQGGGYAVHGADTMEKALESAGYWKAPEGVVSKGDALIQALKAGEKTFSAMENESEFAREYAKHQAQLDQEQAHAKEHGEEAERLLQDGLRAGEKDGASESIDEAGATAAERQAIQDEVGDASFDFGAPQGIAGQQQGLFQKEKQGGLFNVVPPKKGKKAESVPQRSELEKIEDELKAAHAESLPGQRSLIQQEAEEERPDVEGRGFFGGGRFKGERVRTDEIPDAMKAPEAQESRLEAAYGYRKPSMLQRVRETLGHLKGVFRAQEHLPATKEFASDNEFFRLMKVAPSKAQDEAIRTTAAIVDPLGPKQLRLFERLAVMENLSASVALGQPLRFGFQSAEDVDAYRDRLRDIAGRVPEVQKAIDGRKKVVKETVEQLVDYGLLPEAARENVETYYHQQVHFYMLAHGTKTGGRPGKKKRSFQKHRVLGEELAWDEMDYNTSYIEAESSWMTDALMEIEKERLFRELMDRRDILPKLREQANEQKVAWETLVDDSMDIFQPEPGNLFYRAFTLPDRIVEQLQANVLETAELTKEDLHAVLALGGPKAQYVVPQELADQLRASQKVKATHGLAAVADAAMRGWKVYTLLNPKRALAYNLRNMTGDIDPVVAADPSLMRHTNRALQELKGYHEGTLKLSPELRMARDLGVIGSGFVAEEVPDISELPVFRRFLAEAGKRKFPLNPVGPYFETVKKYSQFREDLMRYATFLGYLQQLRQGRVKNYGGSNKAVVDALKREMGVEVAAAHLSRNLLGDYGNITVAGDWLRRRLMPFWAFQEINLKRVPRLAINALESGGTMRTAGVLSASAGRAILTSRIAWMYAAMWIWNHLIQGGDEEEELTGDDRSSPHVILGRNADGSIRVFRQVGALGDFLEWFGINEALAMWPKYKAGQVDLKDILWEMAFSTPEKLMNSMRPDLKALYEVPKGTALYPEPFQPRSVRRGEAVSSIFGLQDEYQWMKGWALKDGSTARQHYWQRLAIGVVDPRHSALSQAYDLRSDFLKTKGKEESGTFPVSKYKEARDAAKFEDYGAFVNWKREYVKDRGEKAQDDFRKWLGTLDPIASRLSDTDELEFQQKFLTNEQRGRLAVARNYSQELRDLLVSWWDADEQSSEMKIAVLSSAFKKLDPTPPKREDYASDEKFQKAVTGHAIGNERAVSDIKAMTSSFAEADALLMESVQKGEITAKTYYAKSAKLGELYGK